MGELIPIDDGGFLSIIHGSEDGLVLPVPFEREIFLFDTHIAGTSFVPGILELEPHINLDEKLSFFREPKNEFDPSAIVIKTESGVKLGYVPKDDNAIFSRLMDAGKKLFGKITKKEVKGKWLKIDIQIFLQEH